MDKLFLNIFNMSISASYLILAVAAARFLLKNAPKSVRCFLWFLVGIRLVIPFSIESVFSLIPNTQVVEERIVTVSQPAVHSEIQVIDTPVNQYLHENDTPDSADSINKTQGFEQICTGIWILGMAGMLGYMLKSWLCIACRIRTAIPVDFAIDAEHQIKIYQSDAIETPFLFGIIRPRIYIPFHIAEESIPYVILHEKAHIKRKDYLIKPVAFLLLGVYWFNPCIWAAYILLCRDIELACDEKVVRELGMEHKKAYSQALVTCAVDHRMITACPVAFGENGVKERVKNILNYKKPAFWVLAAAILACIIIPVCFMTKKKDADIAENMAGEYVMMVSQQEEYLSIPYLSLDTNGGFIFSYDSLSSYLPYGSYEIKGDILTASTEDGQYQYRFTIADSSSLIFNAQQSSEIAAITDEKLSKINAPITDGAVFVKTNGEEITQDDIEQLKELLERAEKITQQLYQGTEDEINAWVWEDSIDEYVGITIAPDEIKEKQLQLAELQKELAAQKELLQGLAEKSGETEEITQLLAQLETQIKQIELAQDRLSLFHADSDKEETAWNYIEQWAQAFCNRDGKTIVNMTAEKAEQELVSKDLLTQDFYDGQDYVNFGWSSPWPWGSEDYDDPVQCNYRIVNVTERSAEILYYAWVSDPHITVWRELLTYTIENDKYVINSETLDYMEGICVAEEFYQAYPGGVISGTMMDYYSFNGAGEALNNNAKANKDIYADLFEPDTAAVYLLNLLKNPNKVGTDVNFNGDSDTCEVTFTFYEDASTAKVIMIQPYGEDGIWLPLTGSQNAGNLDTASASYKITAQNIDYIIEEDALRLEELFPNHHEIAITDFPKYVDLNGDGTEELIEVTDLGYNGGDGGIAVSVTDTKSGKKIPLPAEYTEERGFPVRTAFVEQNESDEYALFVLMGKQTENSLAIIDKDALIRIYERNGMYSGKLNELEQKIKSGGTQADAVSACNIITKDGETTPVLLLKTYVSGPLGHIDTLGYVITELKLQKDNTWLSNSYFLLDSCDED